MYYSSYFVVFFTYEIYMKQKKTYTCARMNIYMSANEENSPVHTNQGEVYDQCCHLNDEIVSVCNDNNIRTSVLVDYITYILNRLVRVLMLASLVTFYSIRLVSFLFIGKINWLIKY